MGGARSVGATERWQRRKKSTLAKPCPILDVSFPAQRTTTADVSFFGMARKGVPGWTSV